MIATSSYLSDDKGTKLTPSQLYSSSILDTQSLKQDNASFSALKSNINIDRIVSEATRVKGTNTYYVAGSTANGKAFLQAFFNLTKEWDYVTNPTLSYAGIYIQPSLEGTIVSTKEVKDYIISLI